MKRLTRSLATGLLVCAPLSSALAGSYNPTASDSSVNTAGGTGSQPSSSSVWGNTGFGAYSLGVNSSGSANAAFGGYSLQSNNSGSYNLAGGYAALADNTSGAQNTALGGFASLNNTNGSYNTAVGYSALENNGSGAYNIAIGYQALAAQPYPMNDIAIGYQALNSSYNTQGNIALGQSALLSAQANNNTAVGFQSLKNVTTGANNIALGYLSGLYASTGNFNIDLGNQAQPGDSQTTRIGDGNQTRTFVSGIYGATLTGGGSTVIINSNGQLGTVVSSARYKKDVTDMGDQSDALFQLRPVTFHYKADAAQETQYGLIAEEVAAVYPELAVRNDKGEVESVRYYELAPMLLNEVKKQRALIEELTARLDKLEAKARASAP